MTYGRSFYANSKEVLHGSQHVADACDVETAALIAEALNHRPACLDTPPPGAAVGEMADVWDVGFDDTDSTPPIYDEHPHAIRREGDEYACKCGVRWPADEGEEHP